MLAAFCAATAYAIVLIGHANRVSAAAKEVAGGKPYCLQVPVASSYRAATSPLDITPHVMSGNIAQHHAILVVGEGPDKVLYNWSYRYSTFKRDVYLGDDPLRRPPVYCKPGNGVVSASLSDDKYFGFELGGRSWSINRDYNARANGGPMASIHFEAVEPDFRAYSQAAVSSNRHRSEYWYVFISLDAEWNRRWMEGLTTSNMYERQGYHREVVRDDAGRLTDVVACFPPDLGNPRSCQNRFIRDGLSFNFRHAPTDREQWTRMQNALVETVRSFNRAP